jgi:hypothetical protein
MDDKATTSARDRMASNPYVPLNIQNTTANQQHALDYIAYYLGEIEDHLQRIAHASETGGGIAQALRDTLSRLQTR